MPAAATHPSRDELSAYSLGQLPLDEAAGIEAHIRECQACSETLAGLVSADSFVDLLKGARRLPEPDRVPPTHPASAPEVPASLAAHPRYEIVDLIGRGGMGDVYEARHRMMNRTVAIKIINRELVRNPEAVDRFRREVRTAAQLTHPNIVTAHDAEQAGDVHYLVMEYVDGVDLSHIVKERGGLPIDEASDYVRQAAIGLQHAHELGMVHRDIKPHNLMVTADGTIKILDFGLASLAPDPVSSESDTQAARGDLTAVGSTMGTPDFISPEQAGDATQADIRSDIYSLGATLYFLLAGRPPVATGRVSEPPRNHAEFEPQQLESLRDDVSADLAAVLSRTMAKNPGDRFQTPADVAVALERFSRGTAPVSGPSPQPQSEPPRRTLRALAITATGIGFLATLIAGVVYFIQTNNGVVRVTVFDDSFKIAIDGQNITATEGSNQPIKLRPGEHKLVVSQGDTELITDKFEIRRNGKIAFRVELFPGEVVVLRNGRRYRSMDWPDAQNPLDDLSVYRPTRGVEHDVVDRISVVTIVDDCQLTAWFTTDRAVVSLNNPTNEERRVTFNYQVSAFDTRDGSDALAVLKDGTCDLTLAPGQSHNEAIDLTNAELPVDHTKDTALIRVSKEALPLQFRSGPHRLKPSSHLEVVTAKTSTVAIWEFRDRLPFLQAPTRAENDADRAAFVKVMSAPHEDKPKRFSGARRMALSDDGRYLIAAYFTSRARLWNVQTGRPTSPMIGLQGSCSHLGFVPRSSIAWLMDAGGTLRLFNAENGQLIRNDDGPSRQEPDVGRPPAFTPDGQVMVSANRPGKLEFWDVKANRVIKVHRTQVWRIHVSTDGKFCFTYSHDDATDEYQLSVWNPRTGESLAGPFRESEITGGQWSVFGAGYRNPIYATNSHRLLTFENDDEPGGTEMVVRSAAEPDWAVVRRVRLPFQALHVYWLDEAHLLIDGARKGTDPKRPPRSLYKVPVDATDASQVQMVSPGRFRPIRFALDRAGLRWLDVRDDSLSCWTLGKETPIWTRKFPPVSWRNRGVVGGKDWVLVHDMGGSAFVFDLNDGSELWRSPSIHWVQVQDSRLLVSDKNGAEVWEYRDQVADAATKTAPLRRAQETLVLPVHAVSPDGRKVAGRSRDETDRIAIWDLVSGERGAVLQGSDRDTAIRAISGDASLAAGYESWGREVTVWDARTGDQLTVLAGHEDRLQYVTFSPSGRYVFTSTGFNTTDGRIWDRTTGELVSLLRGHTDVITVARFSQNEEQVLTGAKDNTARLWTVTSGEPIQTFEHQSCIGNVVFDEEQGTILTVPTGRLSAYVRAGDRRASPAIGRPVKKNFVRLWEARTGELRWELEHPAGAVAAFTADRKQIVTACQGTITWWDAESGKAEETAECTKVRTQDMRITPDGRYLILMEYQKTAQLWDLKKRAHVAELLPGKWPYVDISLDSRTLFARSRRGTFRAWTLADEQAEGE